MITDIAGRITSFFITKGVIADKEKEVFVYSFEMTISSLANLFIVFFLAVVTDNVNVSLCYLLGFMPVRMTGGGYHAKNHFRCMMILVAAYGIFLAGISTCPYIWKMPVSIAAVVTASTVIFLIAPLEDKNHPLLENQKKRLRTKTVMEIIVALLFVLAGCLGNINGNILFAFAAGYLTAAASMLAGAHKNKHN